MLPDLSDIAKRRRKLGLKQTELARAAGVSQSLIAKIESAKIDPSYKKACAIFEALDEAESGERISAKDIYTKNIVSVDASSKVVDATRLMKKHNISQLPVLDRGNVVGSITEETLLARLSDGITLDTLHKTKVSEIMDEAFPRVVESTPIAIINALLQHNKAVMITKKEKIVGMITKADLLKVVR